MNFDETKKAPVEVEYEIGRVEKRVEEFLEFNEGTMIRLDSDESERINLNVNKKLVAKGKVLRNGGIMAIKIDEVVGKKEGEKKNE